jgi:hypothetical protein
MWEQVLSNGVIQSHSGLPVLTGVSPYNGLAIVSTDLTPRNPPLTVALDHPTVRNV